MQKPISDSIDFNIVQGLELNVTPVCARRETALPVEWIIAGKGQAIGVCIGQHPTSHMEGGKLTKAAAAQPGGV